MNEPITRKLEQLQVAARELAIDAHRLRDDERPASTIKVIESIVQTVTLAIDVMAAIGDETDRRLEQHRTATHGGA